MVERDMARRKPSPPPRAIGVPGDVRLMNATAALLAALARCRIVGRLGVGMDNVDLPGCAARGLTVIPATGANARSVAEYVVTMALVLLRGAYFASGDVAAGRWPRSALTYGREVAGKTLGSGRLRLHRPAHGAAGPRRWAWR